MLASCGDADLLEGKSIDFSDFIDSMRAEVSQLKDMCLAGFKLLTSEDADNAGLDESSLKVIISVNSTIYFHGIPY